MKKIILFILLILSMFFLNSYASLCTQTEGVDDINEDVAFKYCLTTVLKINADDYIKALEESESGELDVNQYLLSLTQNPEISAEARREVNEIVSGSNEECEGSYFKFLCNAKKEQDRVDAIVNNVAQDLQTSQLVTRANQDSDTSEDYNDRLVISFENQIRELGFDNFDCMDLEGCDEFIERIPCSENDETCMQNKQIALASYNQISDNALIENENRNQVVEVLSYFQVDSQSRTISSVLQDELGLGDLSLIKEGSGIDQLLTYGTPQQVCLAKIDGYLSVNGLEVEGEEFDTDVPGTDGLISRQRACDNLDFEICADLRAERSEILFGDVVDIITHVYVYNPHDSSQYLELGLTLISGNDEETFDVFNISSEKKDFVELKSKKSYSKSLYLTGIKVPKDFDKNDLKGVVQLNVYNRESRSRSSLDFAIDYPIVTIAGSNADDLDYSHANITSGTTNPSAVNFNRVVLD